MQRMEENAMDLAPNMKTDERKRTTGNQENKAENKHAESVELLHCIRIWLRSLYKALVIVTPVLLMLWLFCLPALVFSEDRLEDFGDLIYKKIQKAFELLALYGFQSVYIFSLFGFYFVKKSLLFCFLPGLILGTLVSVFLSELFGDFVNFLVTTVGILLIYLQQLPDNPPQTLIELNERKKEIAKPLGKMVLVVWVVFFALFFLYQIYLNANLLGKIFLRFVILPTVMACCTSLQLHTLKSVEKKYVDFLIPTVWITTGMLKVFERIFTNGIFNSGDYFAFAVTTFSAAMIEIVNHISYFQRTTLVEKTVKSFSKLLKENNHSVQTIYIDPNEEPQQQQVERKKLESLEKDEWQVDIRKKLICEDISMELMMILTVTFLLYFSHPLIENEKVETIPSFEICVIQLLIQIAFEFISDIFGIYWTITRHKIVLNPSDVEIKNKWFWVWMFFILWQALQIFWFLLTT